MIINCLQKRGVKRKENRFTAKKLPTNRLGDLIEKRVNNFLLKENCPGNVTIRVVSSVDKQVEVKPGMRARYDEEKFPGSFPYRAKAMFAFEEIDGVDVCFFGMHIQEYGSECALPHTRRVYISYLDSVHFFQPHHLRTSVYHEILIGYLEHVGHLGYCSVFIGAQYS